MNLPDPQASRALLVGVSHYPLMAEDRQLPSVENNINQLAAVLSSDHVWGLPNGHCTVLHQPEDADTIIQAIRATADASTDAVLFYFAGHGLTDPAVGSGLYLGLPRSYEPFGTHTGLGYEYVRTEMRRCQAPRKVVVLDCCWSGLANMGLMGSENSIAAIEGAAVLTATAATRPALAPPGAQFTAFTGTLLEILAEGIVNAPNLLTIERIFVELRMRLLAKSLPEPQLAGFSSGTSIVLARNVVASDIATHTSNLQSLQRRGRYDEAQRILLWRAAQGDLHSIRDVILKLQRAGDYMTANELEQAARLGNTTLRTFVLDCLLPR